MKTYASNTNPDDSQAIAAQIKEVLAAKIGRPVASIRLEDDLLADLGLDSLAIAELMTLLEQHLQRPIAVDELLDVTTVQDLANLLASSATGSTRE